MSDNPHAPDITLRALAETGYRLAACSHIPEPTAAERDSAFHRVVAAVTLAPSTRAARGRRWISGPAALLELGAASIVVVVALLTSQGGPPSAPAPDRVAMLALHMEREAAAALEAAAGIEAGAADGTTVAARLDGPLDPPPEAFTAVIPGAAGDVQPSPPAGPQATSPAPAPPAGAAPVAAPEPAPAAREQTVAAAPAPAASADAPEAVAFVRSPGGVEAETASDTDVASEAETATETGAATETEAVTETAAGTRTAVGAGRDRAEYTRARPARDHQPRAALAAPATPRPATAEEAVQAAQATAGPEATPGACGRATAAAPPEHRHTPGPAQPAPTAAPADAPAVAAASPPTAALPPERRDTGLPEREGGREHDGEARNADRRSGHY